MAVKRMRRFHQIYDFLRPFYRIKITNRHQFDCLVATMEKYPPVAKGMKYAEAANFNRKKFCEVWIALTKDLNSLGPPIRSMFEWQKVWNDYKLKTKRKLSHIRIEARATGGGPNQMANLTPCEEAVVALLQLDKAIATEGNVFGLGPTVTPSRLAEQADFNYQEPSCSGTSRPQSGSAHRQDPDSSDEENIDPKDDPGFSDTMPNDNQQNVQKKDQREELLKTQTDFLKDIRDGVKDLARYSRKNYYLQEKKIQLEQENALRKEKQNKEKIQYKIALLEYKKKKLELLESKHASLE